MRSFCCGRSTNDYSFTAIDDDDDDDDDDT